MGCGCSSQAAGVSSPAPQKPCGTCPNGHALQLQERPPCDCCTCDVCGDEIPRGESVWGCRACDYDKCSQCARKWQAGQANGAAAQACVAQSSSGVELVPGQCAIIRNCPNARLNGERVICQEYNAGLGEWTVKGDKFPLSIGMSLGAQFLEVTEPAPTQQAPTLLTGDTHLATGKYKNLLRTVLEKSNEMFQQKAVIDTNVHVGEFVKDVSVHAFGIIHEGSGLGASGECPFASAYEVHLFNQFCLNVCVAWSEHTMGEDEQIDKDFYSQISDLCEILCFLDTSAVPLPEEIDRKTKLLQSDALFPHWVEAQIPKGEAALECCVAVGQRWELQETQAFQKAVAALENIQANHRI